MGWLRHRIRAHGHVVAWLLLAAMALRLLVPAGFMPVSTADGVRLTLCSGWMPPAAPPNHGLGPDMRHDMAMHHDGGQRHGGGNGDERPTPCAFAGLSMPSLAGADPLLLAVLLAFVVATGSLPLPPLRLHRFRRVHPPAQAPPANS